MGTQNKGYKIRLGIFVAAGIAIFAIAIFIIGKQRNLFNPVFKITTTFYNVSGLQVGNNVRFSGINVGTVDRISIINDSTVQVDMMIRKEVNQFIKNDCLASIGSEGIIGDRILMISQGSAEAPQAEEGQELLSQEPVETDEIISSLQITAVNAEIISAELAEIMVNINEGHGTLGQLIQDSTLSESFSATMLNLEKSSQGLEENMEAAKNNILLRGYFNKKKREAERKRRDAQKALEKANKK
ncbi:MAG: MlaD family protein [Flavobacteriales bacterium]|nr:MlaD family protein [Flavobacteriales bacterium]